MSRTSPGTASRWPVVLLLLLLAVSYALRAVLVLHRGQYFWLDENFRFHPCLEIIDALRYGRWREIGDVVAPRHLHTGFFLVGIPVAAVYIAITGYSAYATLWIPALVLSLASIACIALVYALARRLGADGWEALTAAFLMATANSMFYYSRHLLPYDSSLAFLLLTLWLGLDRRTSVPRSLLFGIVASVAYLTYYGYLTSVLAVVVIHVLRGRRLWAIVTRTVASAIGFVVLPLALHAFTILWGQTPFLVGVARIMQLATQGGFEEGWRVIWDYLWLVEHGLLVVWAAGSIATLTLAWRGGQASRARGLLWLAAAGMIYLQLTLNSTVLHKAVVLGRFARQVVPFLCLATAAAAADLDSRHAVPPVLWMLGAAALVVQAGFNFAAPLAQRFPPEVEQEVAARYNGNVAREVSIDGPEWDKVTDRPARYVLLNTVTFLYPAKAVASPTDAGRVLLRYSHPLQFVPYQYEVYDLAGRAVLQSADISMRLIDTWTPETPVTP